MLEYLKFSIGGFFDGYKTIKLWNNDTTATYEVIHSGLMDEVEPGTREEIENHDWLSQWDNLDVNKWDKEYVNSCVLDGTQWELDYREVGKPRRRIYGSNAYPPNWYRFLEWLDLLMPDMEFIPPNQVDAAMFLYHGTGINRIEEEQLYLNRIERSVLLKKGTISGKDNSAAPVYVKSSHSYDFSDAEEIMMEMMDECENYFHGDQAETCEESDERPPYVTIELTYHDGTKRREARSIEACRSEDWGVFMGGIKEYVSDVYSVLLYMFTENPSKHGKYMYCKVRFGNSQRLYSY